MVISGSSIDGFGEMPADRKGLSGSETGCVFFVCVLCVLCVFFVCVVCSLCVLRVFFFVLV